MPNYIVNRNSDDHGYHEVHTTDCNHLPETKNQASLGWCSDAKSAVSKAKSMGYNADGCYYCCNDAHKG